MDDDVTVELCPVGYQAEAHGIESFLQSEGIECIVVPFQDTAMPGVGAQTKPWGEIRVREQDLERARQLLEAWKQGEPENIEQSWDKTEPE
jgi:hypothetical protein